jgi:hypothetical protein
MVKAPLKFVGIALAATVTLCTAGTYLHFIDANTNELFDNKDLAIVRFCLNRLNVRDNLIGLGFDTGKLGI